MLRTLLCVSMLGVAAIARGEPLATKRADWTLSAGGVVTSGAVSARENLLSLRRRDEWGALSIERLSADRRGLSDEAWAIDAYPKLWRGAYANIRLQHSAAPDLYPERVWRAELYQDVGKGWELSASRDHLGFIPAAAIDGVTVGKYLGNFFVRWRHQWVAAGETRGQGDRLMVRYLYRGEADDFVELQLSHGRSYETSALIVSPARSDVRGLFWQHYFTGSWGARLGFTQARDSQSADNIRTVNLTFMVRW